MAESASHATLFGDKSRSKRRRRMFLAFAVVAWLGLNAVAAWALLHPRRVHAFLRFKEPHVDAEGVVERQKRFVTADGLLLSGVVYAPERPKGVVLIFHGYGGARLVNAARRAAHWGYAAVAPDFRAHGASEGSATTFGLTEAADVRAVADEARAEWPDLKVAGWGLSMGGAAMIYADDVSRTFDAIILESVYADIDSAYRRRVETVVPSFLYPFAWPGKKFAEIFGGLDSDAMRPADRIAKLDGARVLITTGELDPWATTDDLRRLAEGCPGSTTRVVEGASHHDVWARGGEAHFNAIKEFLAERLR